MNTQCYLCKNKNLVTRKGSVRDDKNLKILECNSCGLVFLSSFKHIEKSFYENSKMHTTDNSIIPDDYAGLDISEILKTCKTDDDRRYKQYEELIVNKDILDFGCGAGGFLLNAKYRAKNCYGVELDNQYIRHYTTNNLEVIQDIDNFNKKVDIVFMFHVLEHIDDPLKLLDKMKSKIIDGGSLIIEVPNADDALLTLYENDGFSNFTYWSPHLFLYNAQTLSDLMKMAGYKIDYIKQFQRYTLSNHLYWLSNNKPGGHQKWSFLDSEELYGSYASALGKINKCDTIIGSFRL